LEDGSHIQLGQGLQEMSSNPMTIQEQYILPVSTGIMAEVYTTQGERSILIKPVAVSRPSTVDWVAQIPKIQNNDSQNY
jgi:hypothetical protein